MQQESKDYHQPMGSHVQVHGIPGWRFGGVLSCCWGFFAIKFTLRVIQVSCPNEQWCLHISTIMEKLELPELSLALTLTQNALTEISLQSW